MILSGPLIGKVSRKKIIQNFFLIGFKLPGLVLLLFVLIQITSPLFYKVLAYCFLAWLLMVTIGSIRQIRDAPPFSLTMTEQGVWTPACGSKEPIPWSAIRAVVTHPKYESFKKSMEYKYEFQLSEPIQGVSTFWVDTHELDVTGADVGRAISRFSDIYPTVTEIKKDS